MAWPIKHQKYPHGMTLNEGNDWLEEKIQISLDNMFHTPQVNRLLECDRTRNRYLNDISIQIFIPLLWASAKSQSLISQILLEHAAFSWAARLQRPSFHGPAPLMFIKQRRYQYPGLPWSFNLHLCMGKELSRTSIPV